MTTETVQMSVRAADPRPARTRAQILGAVERLGASGAEITVAAIVVEAQISRSTFYSQFNDPGDVAVQLMRELQSEIARNDARLRAECGPLEATSATIRMLISELQRRRHLYACVLGTTASSAKTMYEVCDILAGGARSAIEQTAPESIDVRAASIFIAAGVLAILVDWLHEDPPRAEDQVEAEILELLPRWLAPAEPETP